MTKSETLGIGETYRIIEMVKYVLLAIIRHRVESRLELRHNGDQMSQEFKTIIGELRSARGARSLTFLERFVNGASSLPNCISKSLNFFPFLPEK